MTNELPNYMMELALRTQVGSNFEGRFYLKVKITTQVVLLVK